ELKRDEAVATLALQRALDLLRDGLPDSGAGPAMGCALPEVPGAERVLPPRAPALLPPYRAQRERFVGSVRPDVAEAAVGYLNTALLHAPEESSAWFVRAMINMSRGRLLFAGRDLRRLALLEQHQPVVRQDRLLRLEMLQGMLRAVTMDYAEHV